MSYPPDIHNMKAYYVSKELKRRGAEITWVKVGGRRRRWKADDIEFVTFGAPKTPFLPEVPRLLRLCVFCIHNRIQIVYLDEWLFFRPKPFARLLGQIMLRGLGVKLVLDQRDPYVDFELASGLLEPNTKEYGRLSRISKLMLRQTDLIVLPSRAYAKLYESEGVPRGKVIGTFRGIDQELFHPVGEPKLMKSTLGLGGRFVIGWFGIMHPFRMISEIIVPLIENLQSDLPNAHFLIGGEGPLFGELERLRFGEASKSFTLLGRVPYSKLRDYIAACDVTISPVSPKFRFTMNSNWLKIAESIAVGTPVIATKTAISDLDFKDVGGISWVNSDYGSYLRALKEIQRDPTSFYLAAEEQARNFQAFSIGNRIPMIVKRIMDQAAGN